MEEAGSAPITSHRQEAMAVVMEGEMATVNHMGKAIASSCPMGMAVVAMV